MVKIQGLYLHPYQLPMLSGQIRRGVVIELADQSGQRGWGEIAPLPNLSQESLEQALDQLFKNKSVIFDCIWTKKSILEELQKLHLYSSVLFGLESALLALVDPLPHFSPSISAFFQGSPKEILELARQRKSEGFTSAKLKVGHLSFGEAEKLIWNLKDDFLLRIDVNRAWEVIDSIYFFSQFPLDAFDYVEEPFKTPYALSKFSHPLAVDESFPNELSLSDLENLPSLKALIYKPMIQGGVGKCLPLQEWAEKKGVSIVLSSTYESKIGLASIGCLAQRLKIQTPLGIGTFHYMR